jgi:ribonucleoside-triphosphate reductase
VGTLTGFTRPIKDVQVVRSSKAPGEKGNPDNVETWEPENKVWTIKVGDSSESWAKSVGKLLAGKYPAKKLVLDFSEVRCAGTRLSNFGWISSGDENISKAYHAIAMILNRKAGSLLTKIDIMDVMNWLGTSLSSRRSAQIAFVDYGSNEWQDFAVAKKNYWLTGNPQRAQSNNSLMFYNKPTPDELMGLFNTMMEAGGSEPGFINGQEAERRLLQSRRDQSRQVPRRYLRPARGREAHRPR